MQAVDAQGRHPHAIVVAVLRLPLAVDLSGFVKLLQRMHGLLGGALAVGILDTQHEFTAAAARFQPAVKRGAGTADMQETGGTGGEASADGHGLLCTGMETSAQF